MVPALFTDLDFQLNAGENIVVTGDSGCGKSSLLRVLDGLWPVKQGVFFALLSYLLLLASALCYHYSLSSKDNQAILASFSGGLF